MRKTLLAALALALLMPLQAQITHSAQGQVDKTAAALLRKAADKLASARFTVTLTAYDSDRQQQARQSADVVLSGSKYTVASDDQQIFCDGTTVWLWNKTAREVTVNDMPADGELNLFNPGQMLASYESQFRAKYIRTDDDGTAVVDLQPRSARSFHKLRLLIDEKTGRLKRAEVHKYDSSREVYDFSRHSYGRQTGPFVFDSKAHPDVEIIDMR